MRAERALQISKQHSILNFVFAEIEMNAKCGLTEYYFNCWKHPLADNVEERLVADLKYHGYEVKMRNNGSGLRLGYDIKWSA